jgi:hypothetical protein
MDRGFGNLLLMYQVACSCTNGCVITIDSELTGKDSETKLRICLQIPDEINIQNLGKYPRETRVPRGTNAS